MIAYIKVEAPDLDTIDTLLLPLLEGGGTYHTLVVDGEIVPCLRDLQLVGEEREAHAIVRALRGAK